MAGKKPGKAWIKVNGKWQKPAKPDGNYTWNDNTGWVKVKPTKAEIGEKYGYALAVINSDKDLSDLFNRAWQATKDGRDWSPETFKIELEKTDWFKSKSNTQREYYLLANDPAQAVQFQDNVNEKKASLKTVADRLGANITDIQLTTMAKQAMEFGWNESEIQNALVGYISFTTGADGTQSLSGGAADDENLIRDYAAKMGVDVTNDWILSEVTHSANVGNIDQAKDWIRSRASEKYSPWAEDLKANPNTTIEDLAYNFRTTMANTFEVGVDTIKLDDPYIKSVMQGDANGQKKTQWQFEQDLRKDPRWQTTKNAKESTQTVVNDILSTFGLV